MSRKQVILRIIIILIISLILAIVFFFGLKVIKVIKISNLWIVISKNIIYKIKLKSKIICIVLKRDVLQRNRFQRRI